MLNQVDDQEVAMESSLVKSNNVKSNKDPEEIVNDVVIHTDLHVAENNLISQKVEIVISI